MANATRINRGGAGFHYAWIVACVTFQTLLSGIICLLAAGLVLRINRQPAPMQENAVAREPA